eukprot:TRINITY_DN19756_c0_g2_i2.p1 TRINITY_DN19756_c0_g2~~TRINITY_DN19756_c0_g2_i2.p1  ORF type:complete len:957 (+),score=175.56 TRINITY_DN19756_c0_g2_i2:83-2953(+)
MFVLAAAWAWLTSATPGEVLRPQFSVPPNLAAETEPLPIVLQRLAGASADLLRRVLAATRPLPGPEETTPEPGGAAGVGKGEVPSSGTPLHVEEIAPGPQPRPGAVRAARPPAPVASLATETEQLFAAAAPFSPQCSKLLAQGDWRFSLSATGAAGRRQGATAADIAAGTAALVFAVGDPLGCLTVAVPARVEGDFYIEDYQLQQWAARSRALPQTCGGALREMAHRALGEPRSPDHDVWSRKDGANGSAAEVLLAPRPGLVLPANGTLSFDFPFALCVRGRGNAVPELPGGGKVAWPPISLQLSAPRGPAAGVGGDLARGVSDAVLRDGGTVGTLVLPAGWQWAEGHQTDEWIRASLSATLGPPQGMQDSVAPARSPNCRTVLLGPRPWAEALPARHQAVLRPVPAALALPPGGGVVPAGGLPWADPITVDDAIGPHAELALLPGNGSVIEEEDFLRGGVEVALRLHGGAQWAARAAEGELLAAAAAAFGGAGEGCPDTVTVGSSTQAVLRLGCRQQLPLKGPTSPSAAHLMLPLDLPPAAIVCPAPNSTMVCLAPGAPAECPQVRPSMPLPVSPALAVRRRGRRARFRWVVVGAGVSGVNAIGRLLDMGQRGEEILWLDEAPAGRTAFSGGRFAGYRSVLSTQPCVQFTSFIAAFAAFRSAPLGNTGDQLQSAAADRRHCRLGFFLDALLRIVQHIRRHVASAEGRLEHMDKAWYSGVPEGADSRAFAWQGAAGAAGTFWATQGVVLCIGGESRHLRRHGLTRMPPNLTLAEALNVGQARQRIVRQSPHKAGAGKVRIVVVGSGPSAFIALYNLARLREVGSLIHIVKSNMRSPYLSAPVHSLDGSPSQVTRISWSDPSAERLLSEGDFVVYALGWEVPIVRGLESVQPMGQGLLVAPKLYSVGVRAQYGAERFAVTVVTALLAATESFVHCRTLTTEACFDRDHPEPPPDWPR